MSNIRFIPVTNGISPNSKCYEMFVSIDLHSVVLNSLAVAEMINLFGSHSYDLTLHASECGRYIGIKPVESKRSKLNPQKAITSNPIRNLVKSAAGKSFITRYRYKAKSEGGMIVVDLHSKTDNRY